MYIISSRRTRTIHHHHLNSCVPCRASCKVYNIVEWRWITYTHQAHQQYSSSGQFRRSSRRADWVAVRPLHSVFPNLVYVYICIYMCVCVYIPIQGGIYICTVDIKNRVNNIYLRRGSVFRTDSHSARGAVYLRAVTVSFAAKFSRVH